MGKDPGFIFYPGDYLRDTQCLSEAAQVAYDRIMCEHMRNICLRQDRLNFFTKRLTEEQAAELYSVLTPCPGGYQISWVVDSILKRREYSESRRKNRISKKDVETNKGEHMINTGSPGLNHMEIEIENENVFGIRNKKEWQVSIKKVYANDRIKTIYDLREWFRHTGQLEALELAGFTRFDDFMEANPAGIFDDDRHLYNAFRKFCRETPRTGYTLADLFPEGIED